MKRIIMLVLLFAALKVAGQTTGYLRFDTVKIMKQNGSCELYIINKTKDSLGILTNIGGGLTSFKKSRALNDTTIVVGNDTLRVVGRGGGSSGSFTNADTIIYLSKSSGVISDADISEGSTSFGTDNTTAVQNILNIAGHTKSLKLIWDVKVSVTGLTIGPNTWIEALPGKGAILRNNSNKPLFVNRDTAFGREPVDSNIIVQGGIWNGNSYNAGLNPAQVVGSATYGNVSPFSFYGVRNLILRDFVILRQRAYAVNGINIRNGLYENGIINSGQGATFGDGVHFDGYSEHCTARNLKIKSHDDAIGINADETYLNPAGVSYGYYPNTAVGPVSDINIENIFLDGGQFGIRVLSAGSRVENIRIKNITGSTVGYALIIDNYRINPAVVINPGPGNVGSVQIENVNVDIIGTPEAMAWFNCNIESLLLKDFKRFGYTAVCPTVQVNGVNTVIKSLIIDGYDAIDTGSTNTYHIRIDSATVNTVNIKRAFVKRASANGGVLFYNAGIVDRLLMNNIYVDSLANVAIFVSSHPPTVEVVASNIIHNSSSPSFNSISTAPKITLSNWSGSTQESNFTTKAGDAFPASSTQTGVLTNTDWTTFNNKFTLPSLTSGSVLFSNGTTISQNNSEFYWDNSNTRLGIGVTPATALHIRKDQASATQSVIQNTNGSGVESSVYAGNATQWNIGQNNADGSFNISHDAGGSLTSGNTFYATSAGTRVSGSSAGATFAVQNNNAAGYAGTEYRDNTGTTRVFAGFNIGNGQEFRFNNIAPSGYTDFMINSSMKLRINNNGNITTPSITRSASNTDSSIYLNPSTGDWEYRRINAGSSTTVYTGDSSLTSDRTISTAGNTLTITGTNDNESSFSVINSGTTNANAISGTASGTTSIGVRGTSTSYIGVVGSSTSSVGVQGESSSSSGVVGVSTSGAAFRGQINPSSTNSIANILTLLTTTSAGGSANGFGAAIQYELETATNGNSQTAGSLAFKWTDATTATRTSMLEIVGVNSGTTARKAALAGNGQWTWDGYGSGTHSVTPATTPVMSSGGVIGERVAPKIYTALLSQSGTSDPTVAILGTNEIGTIVWTRNSTGNYTGTLSAAFTADKTWLICQKGDGSGSFVNALLSRASANALTLDVRDNTNTLTDGFTNMSIEIRVYP